MIAHLRRRHRRLTLILFVLLALIAWRQIAQPAVDARVDAIPDAP